MRFEMGVTIMSATPMMQRISEAPRSKDRLVGIYYLLTILTGAFVLFFHGRSAFVVDLIVGVSYIAITAFFYVVSSEQKE
jgi:multisubunit Na+/H+ antiporter MnhF subunit